MFRNVDIQHHPKSLEKIPLALQGLGTPWDVLKSGGRFGHKPMKMTEALSAQLRPRLRLRLRLRRLETKLRSVRVDLPGGPCLEVVYFLQVFPSEAANDQLSRQGQTILKMKVCLLSCELHWGLMRHMANMANSTQSKRLEVNLEPKGRGSRHSQSLLLSSTPLVFMVNTT